ncbi:MAG: helix-turn-helix transcriptional regulator [Acidimicrobiales bacterium]
MVSQPSQELGAMVSQPSQELTVIWLYVESGTPTERDKIAPEALVDAHGVADILGLSHRSSVSTYRRRHADFPAPVVDLGAGRCLLWLRPEVEAWAAGR